MKNDDLGNRMKEYEGIESDRRCLPFLPVLARLDGKCFHSFTKDLNRPFDIRLSEMRKWTTKYLVEETNALLGYTQSDGICGVINNDVKVVSVKKLLYF